MIQIIKYFWENSIKPQGGFWRFFRHYLFYPSIIVIGFYCFKKYGGENNIFNTEGRKNLINMFAIVSGFLLTGLSVILSNTNIKNDKIEEIKNKYKLHVMEYGKGDVATWISKFKLSILLETILLIGICIILAIIVTIFKSDGFMVYLMIYFLSILFLGLLTLIRQILTYLSIVEFSGR